MNSEVLKRDLFERVFDEVKVFDVWEENVLDIDYTSQTYDTKCVGLKVCIDRNERFKPILFTTSALKNPIQIASYNNGEPFVPIDLINDELNKRITCDVTILFNYYFYNYRIFLCRGEHDYYEEVEIWNDENHFLNCPLWIVDLLKKWHINYRLSPDQFIEVTDSFNPYK